MTESARVLFYVQHLLGIGHLKRTALIAKEMSAVGIEVTVASGGFPVDNLDTGRARLVQLPPTRSADALFSALLDETGQPLSDAWKQRRRDRLLALFDDVAPTVLMTEMYPFGRRLMRFELTPLLERARAAQPRPLTVCSVRDVLTRVPTEERSDWILGEIARFFDAVLVHGDRSFLGFEKSFPRIGEINGKLHYTGYVADAPAHALPETQRDTVVVSAGGGAVAQPLIDAALAARPLCRLHAHPWQILVGQNFPTARLEALQRSAAGNVTLARAHSGFLALLSSSVLSISQGGYNTITDILRAGPRAVIVPFAAGGEGEQTVRARTLEEAGRVVVVEETELGAECLAAAIDRAMATENPVSGLQLDMNGAAKTARWIYERTTGVPAR